MSTLLNLFYGLPIEFIVQCFFLLTLVYLCFRRRFARCRWFRPGICITLTVWIAAVLWITTLSRSPSSAHSPEPIPFHSYRELLAGGSYEILRSNFMNVALFFPSGLLLGELLPSKWSIRARLLSSAAILSSVSLTIELIQYWGMLGQPEIDDVIHNTLGAILGTLPIVFRDNLLAPGS